LESPAALHSAASSGDNSAAIPKADCHQGLSMSLSLRCLTIAFPAMFLIAVPLIGQDAKIALKTE